MMTVCTGFPTGRSIPRCRVLVRLVPPKIRPMACRSRPPPSVWPPRASWLSLLVMDLPRSRLMPLLALPACMSCTLLTAPESDVHIVVEGVPTLSPGDTLTLALESPGGDVAWASTRPEAIEVDGAGRIRAGDALGQALVIARVAGVGADTARIWVQPRAGSPSAFHITVSFREDVPNDWRRPHGRDQRCRNSRVRRRRACSGGGLREGIPSGPRSGTRSRRSAGWLPRLLADPFVPRSHQRSYLRDRHERTPRPKAFLSCCRSYADAGGGGRTHTGRSPGDFKSPASAVSPPRRGRGRLWKVSLPRAGSNGRADFVAAAAVQVLLRGGCGSGARGGAPG